MSFTFALTELLGATVYEAGGKSCGRVRELAVAPQEDPAKVSALIVRTKVGDRLLPCNTITGINGGIKTSSEPSDWHLRNGGQGLFLLERDLLDQQVIDVHGRKVVRVNDVDLHQEVIQGHMVLKVGSVDVGARGAVRRLLKGVVPSGPLKALLRQIPPRPIPWEFVDV